MKKYILGLLAVLVTTVAVNAATVTITVPPSAFTNVLAGFSGTAKVTQIIVAAATATNTAVTLVDTPTNSVTYTVPGYTNTVSYATNGVVQSWTNYFGVVNYATNFTLVDLTNNAVASSTANYPARVSIAAASGTSSSIPNANYYFLNGIWATNTSSGSASVTITYQQ
jgi:hypothetical protein